MSSARTPPLPTHGQGHPHWTRMTSQLIKVRAQVPSQQPPPLAASVAPLIQGLSVRAYHFQSTHRTSSAVYLPCRAVPRSAGLPACLHLTGLSLPLLQRFTLTHSVPEETRIMLVRWSVCITYATTSIVLLRIVYVGSSFRHAYGTVQMDGVQPQEEQLSKKPELPRQAQEVKTHQRTDFLTFVLEHVYTTNIPRARGNATPVCVKVIQQSSMTAVISQPTS